MGKNSCRFRLFALAIIFISGCFIMKSETSIQFESDGFRYTILSEEEKTLELTKYIGEDVDVKIPSEVIMSGASYKVISIDHYALYGCDSILTVTIPATLESISKILYNNCFINSNCKSLCSIEVDPENPFYSSEDGILYDKDKTVLIYWPRAKGNATMPETVKVLEFRSIYSNTAITSLRLPEAVEEIGLEVLSYCSKLEEVYFPATLQTIGFNYYLTRGCPLFTTFDVHPDNPYFSSPNGVLCNKDGTVLVRWPQGNRDYSLFPETVVTLDKFSFTTSPAEVILPDWITTIKSSAFFENWSLEKIKLPESLTYMDGFYGCRNLQSVIVPPLVTTIESAAFMDCDALSYVDLPAGITSIGRCAFGRHWNSYSTFICRAPIPPTGDEAFYWDEGDAHERGNIGIAKLYVPSRSIELYKTSEPWCRVTREILPLDDEDDDETAIGYLYDNESEEFIVYSLSGSLILKTKNKEDLNHLPKGIYIINGKKTVLNL